MLYLSQNVSIPIALDIGIILVVPPISVIVNIVIVQIFHIIVQIVMVCIQVV